MNSTYYLLYLRYQDMTPRHQYVSRGVETRYLQLETVVDYYLYRIDAATGIRRDMKKYFVMFQRIIRGRRKLLQLAFRFVRERERTGICGLSRLYQALLVKSGGESTIWQAFLRGLDGGGTLKDPSLAFSTSSQNLARRDSVS